MNNITVWDEMTSTLGRPRLAFTLAWAETTITLRELIRARVAQEVQTYNAQQNEYFQGLVQPAGAEQTLNGYRLPQQRQVSVEQQVDTALAAFETNGFVVLVDDEQVEDLDAQIALRPELAVTFLKLVPLVGG
jgi:hypothetical protein